MSNKEYPLDISLICSVALEGGLKKHKEILPALPTDSMEFIHEWNRALTSTLRSSEFKKHLGVTGRVIATLRSPKLAAELVDKVAVPYRSFHYAKRFTDAFNFTSDKLVKFGTEQSYLLDFGRGLSPWTHLMQLHNKHTEYQTIDSELSNAVHEKTSHVIGLNGLRYGTPDSPMNACGDLNNIFVSLGTFVYLPKPQQEELLILAFDKFKHAYIELELAEKAKDSTLVKNIGAEYQQGWEVDEIANKLNKFTGRENWAMKRLSVDVCFDRYHKLKQAVAKSTEFYIQK